MPKRRRILAYVIAVFSAVPLLVTQQASAVTTLSPLQEEDFGGDIWFGGRSLAIAVSPANKLTAIEAAETGGLFRTTNGGASWSRLANFPQYRTADVMYDPANASVVIATARDDAKNPSGAGVWRSIDGGNSWSLVAAPFSSCTDFTGLAAAPVTPTMMFAAYNCGVYFSSTAGQVWAPFFAPSMAGTWDVAATTEPDPTTGLPRAVAYTCGSQGISKAVQTTPGNSAVTWSQVSTGYPANGTPCSVDISPQNPNVVFVTNRNCASATCSTGEKFVNRIYEFKFVGTTPSWRELAPAPTAPARGGRPPYVVTHNALDGHGGHYDIYWGTGVATYRQHCASASGTAGECFIAAETVCNEVVGSARDEDGDGVANEGCPLVGAGPELDGEGACKDFLDNDGDNRVNDGCPIVDRFDNGTHVDPSHIAFDPTVPNRRGCPLLLSNDGGIGRSTNCGTSWVDSNAGRRALQIYNVYGTSRGSGLTDTDIYFGTQDNGTWYSLDNGLNWSRAQGADGVWGMVDRRVPPEGPGAIRVVQEWCASCRQEISQRGYQGTTPFPTPPGGWANTGWRSIVSFGPQRYAQFGYQLDAASQITQSRLYLMQPETGTACGNAVDDDFDGAVNDGCAPVGSPETGNACHGAGDADGDGAVNDGCSHIFSAETSGECGSNPTDDDGDGVVNDGCPVDTAAESGADCLDGDDGDGDSKVNDGCPESGVWGPMGPFISASFGGRPESVQASGSPTAPTFYFVGDGNLYKIVGPMSPAATWQLARGTTLGRLGWTTGVAGNFGNHRVYGVAPSDSNRLYAVDTASNQMKASVNGGASWYVDGELTQLVTARSLFEYPNTEITTITAISFDPENPDTILVGTMESGIFATVDGGLNWFKVAFSEQVPLVTSFFFDKDRGRIWASSYGRGLWSFFLERADLRTTIGESSDPVAPGEVFTYHVGVRNYDVHLRTARGVKATIQLPDQVSYVSANRTCQSQLIPTFGLFVTCEMGDIDPGGTAGVDIRVQVNSSTPNGATLESSASAESSTTYDPNTSNDRGTSTTTVCFNPLGTCGSSAFGGGAGLLIDGVGVSRLLSVSLVKESNLQINGIALVELAEAEGFDRIALDCVVYKPPGPQEPGGTPPPGALYASGFGLNGRSYYMAFVDYAAPVGVEETGDLPGVEPLDYAGISEDPSGGECQAGGVTVGRLAGGSYTFGQRRPIVIAG